MSRNFWIFLILCLPVRLSLAVGSFFLEYSDFNNNYFIGIACVIAAGFFYSDYTKKKKGFFGGKRYWHSSIHGISFLIYALMLAIDAKVGFIILTLDALYGTLIVVDFYTENPNR